MHILVVVVMPFVAFVKDQVVKKGANALNSAIDFDEYETLVTNLIYLQETLKVGYSLEF